MFHVLYVDDEPSLLEIGKIFLERGGEFSVDTITSAPDALNLMQSANYDAIISDYLMPEMDGIEFLKRVRNSGNRIPFILFTGRGREEIVIQALNEGADFYLQKGGEPLSQFTELAYKIRQAVQRQRAEAIIRDHERREQDIINFLPDATVAIDKNGFVIAWNRAMEEMTGISASDMLGKGDHEYALPFYGKRVPILIDLIFAPPDDVRERYSHIVRDGAMLAAETALPRLRGESRTLWGRASPLYDQSGELVGAIESIRDITERGKAEMALRKSEELHRSLFFASPDGIVVTDLRGTIVNASPRALELFGLVSLGDAIGSNVIDWIAPEDRDSAREALENVFSGAASPGYREFRVHKKDGTGFLASISSSIISGNDGKPAGLVSILRNVTHTKEVQEQLRESEEKYRTLVETSFDGIVIHQDGKIVYANDTALRIMGAEGPDRFVGTPLLTYVHPDYRDLVAQRTVSASEQTLPVIQEKFVRVDGNIIDVDVAARPISWKNGPAVYVAFRDITERRKSEAALQERENRIRAIFDSTFQFTGLMTPDGILTDANRTALGFIGVHLEDVVNRPFWETPWWKGDTSQTRKLQDAIREAAAGRFVRYETEIGGTGDARMLADFSIKPVFDAEGTVSLLIIEARDITERRLAEDALRKKEAQQRQIIDLVPHMIFAKDPEGKYILANRAVAEGYNTTVSDLEGKPQALFHKDRDELRHMLKDDREVMATGKTKFIPEEPYIDASGKRRYLQTIKVPFYTLGGKEPAILGVAVDITERRQAEIEMQEKNRQLAEAQSALRDQFDRLSASDQRIRESERKYRAFFSTSRDFVFITSKDGAILDFNDAAVEAAGYGSREELSRARMTDLYANAGDREAFIRDISREGFLKDYPLTLKKKDGSIAYTLLSAVVLRDEAGNVSGFQGIIHDISERKRIEQDLQTAQEQLTETYRLAHIGVWEWVRETDTITWSDELYRITGWDPSQPVPPFNAMEHYFTPESWISLKGAVHDAVTRGSPFNLELEVIRRHHGRLWIHVFGGAKCNEQGSVIQLHGTVQDVTERHMMEEAIRESNRKLNLLSGITRHDIQNQLLSVRGYLSLAQEHTRDPVVIGYLEKEEKILETIERQIAFTRNYQDMGIQSTAWQNINEIVLHSALQLPMRNIRVDFDRTDLEILADPLLEKVFYNLIDNALRYGGDRMTTIRVSSRETEKGLILVCEDNGNGISLEDKRKLFTKGFGKNTGFGLFLSREILSITGITITETGTTGKGARFELTVPKGKYRFGRPV